MLDQAIINNTTVTMADKLALLEREYSMMGAEVETGIQMLREQMKKSIKENREKGVEVTQEEQDNMIKRIQWIQDDMKKKVRELHDYVRKTIRDEEQTKVLVRKQQLEEMRLELENRVLTFDLASGHYF